MNNPLTESGRVRDSGHFSSVLRGALVIGVVIHLLGFFMFRVVSDPLPQNKEAAAFITLVETDLGGDASELMEQASLFDSAPLFIPGEWSSGSEIFAYDMVQNRKVFQDYEPDIDLMNEVRPRRLSLPEVADVEEPSDLLHLRFWKLFDYFGQRDAPLLLAHEPGNSVATVSILAGTEKDSGSLELRLDVDVDVSSGQFAARPIICFLNMAAPGLPAGDPLLTQSSGSNALDAEVLEWLTRPATLAKLPGGFLRLRVFLD